MKKILLIASGASGQIYTHKFIESLPINATFSLIPTETANKISLNECGKDYFKTYKYNSIYKNNSFYAPPASGSSFDFDALVVLPASTGFIARVATGISSNLSERTFDVAQKENCTILVGFREFPLTETHLQNLLTLKRQGVIICPLTPSFYSKPKTLDESIRQTVGRIQHLVGIANSNYKKWESNGQQ